MALPALDPHPYGCPISAVATAEDMPDLILGICSKLADILHPTIHVIHPSKGSSYPILSLYVDDGDPKPRLVLFPGWEAKKRSAKRRLDYARQMTLLQRIVDAGVHGETLDQWRNLMPIPAVDGPLMVSMALSAPLMEGFVTDLEDILGDHLRMTVQTIQDGPLPMHVVKVYAPTAESQPRLILFPGWSSAIERKGDDIGAEQRVAIVGASEEEEGEGHPPRCVRE